MRFAAGLLASLAAAAVFAQTPGSPGPVPDHYHNFSVAVYARAYEVDKMKDDRWLQHTWAVISHAVKVNKV